MPFETNPKHALSGVVKTGRLVFLGMAFLGWAAGLTGCSLAATELQSGNQKVMVPWVENGEYKVQSVDLQTLRSVPNLEGDSALFMLSPSLVNQRLMGMQPRARTFLDAQGVHVPTDQLSLHLLTLYAHLEKLRDLDTWVGLENLLPQPRVVGVEVRIPQKRRNSLENNALYSPQLDALLFVPYQGDDLPLTVNGGVIAHEHFHALFNYLVLKPTANKLKSEDAGNTHPGAEKEMREIFIDLPFVTEEKITPVHGNNTWELYHVNLLRAMNEGLADLWGWVYSGDVNFVGRSLPFLKTSRHLENKVFQISSRDHFRERTTVNALSGKELNVAYELANQYAASFRGVFAPYMKKNQMDRRDLARQIIKVLPALTERIQKLDREEWLEPAVLVEIFAENLVGQERELCAPLMRLVPKMDDAQIESQCQKLNGDANAEPLAGEEKP